MAGSDFEIRRDELERDNLQSVIFQVETALAVSTPGTRGPLEQFLHNAKGRVSSLEKKIKESLKEREEERQKEQSAATAMAEREAALSESERKTFAGFLEKRYFTKSDFGELKQFYSDVWDRLSERGKDEMSHRIWEGIRKKEYTFGELPEPVREKETERAYQVLKNRDTGVSRAVAIPERDRSDFIRAYEGGRRQEAQKILERESVKTGVFREPESAARTHVVEGIGRESEKSAVAVDVGDGRSRDELANAPKAANKGGKDLSKFGLEGVTLTEVESQGTSAELPNGRVAANTSGRSTPGG